MWTLNGLRRASFVFQSSFCWGSSQRNWSFKTVVCTSAVVYHTETNVKMLVHVDDPLCIGEAKLIDNLFTALGQKVPDRRSRSDRVEASLGPRQTRVEDTHRISRDSESRIL